MLYYMPSLSANLENIFRVWPIYHFHKICFIQANWNGLLTDIFCLTLIFFNLFPTQWPNGIMLKQRSDDIFPLHQIMQWPHISQRSQNSYDGLHLMDHLSAPPTIYLSKLISCCSLTRSIQLYLTALPPMCKYIPVLELLYSLFPLPGTLFL